jgi:hypothetical protein
VGDIALVVIAVALVWLAWELHRIVQVAINFMRGYEEGYLQRRAEIEDEGN